MSDDLWNGDADNALESRPTLQAHTASSDPSIYFVFLLPNPSYISPAFSSRRALTYSQR